MQLNQITFTRFIAALTVVFFHYGQDVFPANIDFLFENVTAGPIAVGYFYVLSGFIMAIAYYQPETNDQTTISKKKYWIARVARIYPVYLLALLIIVAAKYKTLSTDWAAVPLHIFLLQSWIPGYPITLNTPGWSLSVEAFFYFCFPFLLAWIYKHGTRLLTVFSIVLWIATQFILLSLLNSESYALKTLLHDFIYYNPLMHLNTFIMGLLVGVFFKRIENNKKEMPKRSNNTIWLILLFSLIFLLIWARPYIEHYLDYKIAYTNGLLTPVFLLFIILLARNSGLISKVFNLPILILLGEASYSLYILQKPIHGLYDKIIVPRINLTENIHFYIFLLILIAVSILSYLFLEKPARNAIRTKLS